jgi:hypothetical protein
MKSENQIRGALVDHFLNIRRLKNPEILKKYAEDLGWTEEYLKGYMEGVTFAYEWMLK